MHSPSHLVTIREANNRHGPASIISSIVITTLAQQFPPSALSFLQTLLLCPRTESPMASSLLHDHRSLILIREYPATALKPVACPVPALLTRSASRLACRSPGSVVLHIAAARALHRLLTRKPSHRCHHGRPD